GTAMLSYFTLPNSNHERKSSPNEKMIFCIRSFLTRCLKSHGNKFTGHPPAIPNSSGRSAGAIGDGCGGWALFARPAGQHDEAAPVSRRRGNAQRLREASARRGRMNFASDNAAGIAPQILAAISSANAGAALAYGQDAWTRRVEARFAEIFAHDVAVF